MGVEGLKSYIHNILSYTKKRINLSQHACSINGKWNKINQNFEVEIREKEEGNDNIDNGREEKNKSCGLVFDGGAFHYWATDAPWCVSYQVDSTKGGQSLSLYFTFYKYFERFLCDNIPICVIFDGISPKSKLPTQLLRSKNISRSRRLAFSNPIMVQVLRDLQIVWGEDRVKFMTALGEADAECIRFARSYNAFGIIGNDYDFIILQSNCPNVLFIPLISINFLGTEHCVYPQWKIMHSDTSSELGTLGKTDSCNLSQNYREWSLTGRTSSLVVDVSGISESFSPHRGNQSGSVYFVVTSDKLRISLKVGSNRYLLAPPTIEATFFSITEIAAGLGLDVASLPVFATLVGSDSLPSIYLSEFHRKIGVLKIRSDRIPGVAGIVRQHHSWGVKFKWASSKTLPDGSTLWVPISDSHQQILNTLDLPPPDPHHDQILVENDELKILLSSTGEVISLSRDSQSILRYLFQPFNEKFIRSIVSAEPNLPPLPVPSMVQNALSFFTLEIPSDEHLFDAQLRMLGINDLFRGGDLDSLVGQFITSLSEIPDEIPLQYIRVPRTVERLDSPYYHKTRRGFDIFNTLFKKIILQIDQARLIDAEKVTVESSLRTLFEKFGKTSIFQISTQIEKLTVINSFKSIVAKVPKSPVSYQVSYFPFYKFNLRLSLLECLGSSGFQFPNAFADVLSQFDDTLFFDFLSVHILISCGYSHLWGEFTDTLVKSYLICMILKSERCVRDNDGKHLNLVHVESLCLDLEVGDECHEIISFSCAIQHAHLLLHQLLLLLRHVFTHGVNQSLNMHISSGSPVIDCAYSSTWSDMKVYFDDLVDGRLLCFVYNSLLKSPNSSLLTSVQRENFELLYNIYTTFQRPPRFNWHQGSDLSRDYSSESDSDDKESDEEFSGEEMKKNELSCVERTVMLMRPPLRGGEINPTLERSSLLENIRRYEIPKPANDWIMRDKNEGVARALMAQANNMSTLGKKIITPASASYRQGDTFQSECDRISFYPYEFQQTAFEHLREQHSILVLAPTGSGKTKIALFAIYQILQTSTKRIAIVCPTKALANQYFKTIFMDMDLPPSMLGIQTDDIVFNANAQILVTMTQSLLNKLLNGQEPYDTVVIDEFHNLLNDNDGYIWENLVTLLPTNTVLVALSATLPYHDTILAWMEKTSRKMYLVQHHERIVKQELYTFARGNLSFMHQSLLLSPNDRGLDLTENAISATNTSFIDALLASYYNSIKEKEVAVQSSNFDDEVFEVQGISGLPHETISSLCPLINIENTYQLDQLINDRTHLMNRLENFHPDVKLFDIEQTLYNFYEFDMKSSHIYREVIANYLSECWYYSKMSGNTSLSILISRLILELVTKIMPSTLIGDVHTVVEQFFLVMVSVRWINSGLTMHPPLLESCQKAVLDNFVYPILLREKDEFISTSLDIFTFSILNLCNLLDNVGKAYMDRFLFYCFGDRDGKYKIPMPTIHESEYLYFIGFPTSVSVVDNEIQLMHDILQKNPHHLIVLLAYLPFRMASTKHEWIISKKVLPILFQNIPMYLTQSTESVVDHYLKFLLSFLCISVNATEGLENVFSMAELPTIPNIFEIFSRVLRNSNLQSSIIRICAEYSRTGALIYELILPETSSVHQLEIFLMSWNLRNKSIHSLRRHLLRRSSETISSDVIALISSYCTNSSYFKIQIHEAISLSFLLLEAHQLCSFLLPSTIKHEAQQLYVAMVQNNWGEFIRVKLIQSFKLHLSCNDPDPTPLFCADPVSKIPTVPTVTIDDIVDDWDQLCTDDPEEMPPFNEFCSNIDISSIPELCRASAQAFVLWSSDLLFRQSQRVHYESISREENCFQLIQYLQCRDMLPALVFTFNKDMATEMASKLVDLFDLQLLSEAEKNKVRTIVQENYLQSSDQNEEDSIPKWLQSLLYRGIGVHHSDINSLSRDLIERLYSKKLLRVIFNTSSLAEGVDMPCETVVFINDQPNFLDQKKFKQCAGRAGRMGNSVKGNVVVTGNFHIDRIKVLLSGGDDINSPTTILGGSSMCPTVGLELFVGISKLMKKRHASDIMESKFPLYNMFFPNQKTKRTFLMKAITEMIGSSLLQLLPSLNYIDINLKPCFLFILYCLNQYLSEQRHMTQSLLQESATLFISLILRCQPSSDGATRESFKPKPLLASFPPEIVVKSNKWNALCVQALFHSESNHRLNPKKHSDVIAQYQSPNSQKFIQVNESIQQKQLVLEVRNNIHRVPSFSDGLSGHAYAYVASGLNYSNMNQFFSYPIRLLPIFDIQDTSISEKHGYLSQLIFTPEPIPHDIIHRYGVNYQIPSWKIIKSLRNILRLLNTLKRLTSTYFTLIFHPNGPYNILQNKITNLLNLSN